MKMLSVFALLLPLVSFANAERGGGNGADCSADSTVCANGLVCCPDDDTCKPQPKCFPDCVSNGGDIETISDGSCTHENNIEACGYDGGDCCVCDCEDSETTCGSVGYDCQDPASGCNYSDCNGFVPFIQDGWCDSSLNSDDCGYDGGDCCECDCLDGLQFTCGVVGYNCQDPTSECTDVTTVDTSTGDEGGDGKKNGVGAECDINDPTGCPNGLVCCEGQGNICVPKPKCDDDN